MIEVLWHGRGGQGAFTAARLLGAAASLIDGRHALAFPSFGPERRGAPMRAFTKLADEPIGDRSAVARADYVVYLDDTLLGDEWADELKPGGLVLVNSVLAFHDPRILAIDADGMSAAVLGRPIPNTVFLGAISALCEHVRAENVKEAIRQYMPPKLHAKNIALVDAARELVERLSCDGAFGSACSEADGAPHAGAADSERSESAAAESVDRTIDRFVALAGAPQPPRPDGCAIPTLRCDELQPEKYARSTCYEAGFLVAKNAGWRNVRPVVDRVACTGCLECYMHCPDGTIYKVDADFDDAVGASTGADATEVDGAKPKRRRPALVAVDYDFCKGCGVCAKVCRFEAIAMVSEREALASERTADAPTAVEGSAATAGIAFASNASEQAKGADAR